MEELEKFAREAEETPPAQAGASATGAGYDKTPIIEPESIIKGGQQEFGGAAGVFTRMLVGPGEEVRFDRPVAVGGIDNFLYIVDAGQRIVFRYNLTEKTITAIGNVGSQFAGEPGNIFVNDDRSFHIVDSVGKRVFHFDESGLLLNTYSDPANLSRPIDVWVDQNTGEILVADGSYSHIVVFNQFGKAMRAIGRRGTGPGRFRAITDMTVGPEGLYVVDRLELPIQVMTREGFFKYSFGEAHQIFPTSIAVDKYQRVYVSDKSDNTIRVYRDGDLVAEVGGGGHAPGRFRIITNMWVQGEFLYVADSQNRRVQVLRLNSPAGLTLPLG